VPTGWNVVDNQGTTGGQGGQAPTGWNLVNQGA
jgi:hypothetical protein